MSDVKAIKHETFRGTEVVLARTRGLCSEAEIAARMIERWGCVAVQVDGEDSAGRQKVRLVTSEELVNRACNVAEKMFDEFTKRGWVVDIPLPVYTEEK